MAIERDKLQNLPHAYASQSMKNPQQTLNCIEKDFFQPCLSHKNKQIISILMQYERQGEFIERTTKAIMLRKTLTRLTVAHFEIQKIQHEVDHGASTKSS